MKNEQLKIKILLKYYKYKNKNNNIPTNNTSNEIKKASSKSNNISSNHRDNFLGLHSNENRNGIKRKSNNNNKSILNMNINESLSQDYLIYFQTDYPYNYLESTYPPKVINIKTCIYIYLLEKKKLDITLDSLMLFSFSSGKYILLNDEDSFCPQKKSNKKILNHTNKDENENNISNSTIIYYYINPEKIKIMVELYSKNIDSISLNISKTCSLLMLKYIILLKLREMEKSKDLTNMIDPDNKRSLTFTDDNLPDKTINDITIDELVKNVKIYGNGIINDSVTQYLIKKQTNRNFNNSTLLSEIYNYYFSSITNNENKVQKGILCFIMMEQKGKKCSLGLDFRFTVLQYFLPHFEENEPEDKDDIVYFKSYFKNEFSSTSKNGLNLYFTCINENCKYYNKCFIFNIGYGTYDIFNLVKYNLYCHSCYKSKQEFFREKNKTDSTINETNNNLVLKYIGMMNAQWAYKGSLLGIKMTNVGGKGMAILKDILYKTNEFDFLSQFKKLVLQVERYNPINEYTPENTKNDDSICADDINLINSGCDNNPEQKNKEIDINKNKINNFDEDKKNSFNEQNKKNEGNIIVESAKVKKEDEKKDNNMNNIINIDNNTKYDGNESKNNLENSNEKNNNQCMCSHAMDIKEKIKQMNIKTKLNNIRTNNSANNLKGIYFGNAKQFVPVGEGNETNNTNSDFNIIIDRNRSNCCDKCLDYHPMTQMCLIF